MRNYTNIDRYLDNLGTDVYPQPPDDGHTAWAMDVMNKWVFTMRPRQVVLDVGCGEAFLQPEFEEYGDIYFGVCLHEDFTNAKEMGRRVFQQDFSFLDFPDNTFDLIFSRHSLEHSPMPVITLMEWNRLVPAGGHLILVMPDPEYWGWAGRNHYSVANDKQIRFWLERSGWIVEESEATKEELRYLCVKGISD